MKYLTSSEDETRKLGSKLARDLKSGSVIALSGELGVGKTIFAQGIALGLGVKEKVLSPTFVIIRKHKLAEKTFYHVDLYRLDKIDPRELGIEEILSQKENIVLIEWADKLKILPKKTIFVNFKKLSSNQREISVMI